MSAGGRHGREQDEMFLQRRPTADEAPVIEPLRIQKRSSNSSQGSGVLPAGQAVPIAQAEPTRYPMPSLPQMPGLPQMPDLPQVPGLPYPDDEARRREEARQAARANGTSSPYQYPNPRRVASPEARQNAASPLNGGRKAASASVGQSQEPASVLAQRRGNSIPKPLPDSPGPERPDKDSPELFQRAFARRRTGDATEAVQSAPAHQTSFPANVQQPQFPAPTMGNAAQAAFKRLNINNPASLGRIDSTASNTTTKATRGSPPPPETPLEYRAQFPASRPLTDIEQRFAQSGIAGEATLTALQAQQAQSLASQQRAAQYGNRKPSEARQQQQPPRRPWTPTEQPGQSPHPATVYQGQSEAGGSPPEVHAQPASTTGPQSPSFSGRPNPMESEVHGPAVPEDAPPAYSSVTGMRPGQYPSEKARYAAQARQGSSSQIPQQQVQGQPVEQPDNSQHPAFLNDQNRQQAQSSQPQPLPQQAQPQQNGQYQQNGMPQRQPSQSLPQSPPPLPEGWIAHLDPNSGQYYYIHLPTNATQWEFPKGPTPLNLSETPLSPTGNVSGMISPGLSFMKQPLASPGLMSPGMPMSPGFDTQSIMSGSLSNPATFNAPVPGAGVELYKVAATNGVYFGPYLRYTNMDLELGFWYGSIMIVTDAPQPPTIHLHQSTDLSPNPRQLKAQNIANHRRWSFYKYEVDVRMEIDGPAKWTYAITSHLGCTRYEFLVAGRYETNWRFVATSGNDFSLNTSANERAKLGGIGYMWKDIMQKHVECGGFHTQLGLGGQISADRLWKEIPSLKQWLGMSGKENRKNAVWTAAHEEDVGHAYFHYYTSHFDQPYLREAFAQIPHICTIDDHDIFDGFGSYPDYMQFSNMFKNIGRIGIENYLLFQHHTTLDILSTTTSTSDHDLFTITGTGWHFVKFLGPAVAVVGPDTRSERNPNQVMAGPTYQGIFPKIAMLPASVQHCILMIAVPVIYPRLESMEQIANTVATGKKAVTGAYNVLGKVAGGVAGVVGAKGAVNSGFDSVKRAVGKSGLMGGILNPFGDFDVLDELKDQWTHESKDLERTYLIRTLQTISASRNIRFTFLSGATNTCGAGLVHDPSHPSDHKTMYQLISSSVVAAPPQSYILKLLNSNKTIYIPANGTRSSAPMGGSSTVSDTKEDMMELFTVDPATGQPITSGNKRLCARRNYVAIVAFDPEQATHGFASQPGQVNAGSGKVSLAADFIVQAGEGQFAASGLGGGVVKFGPVVVPSLEFGR